MTATPEPQPALAELRRELGAAGLLRPAGPGYLAWAALNALALAGCLAWLVVGPADGGQLVAAALAGALLVPVGFVAHDAGHGAVFRRPCADARLSWLWWTLLTGLSEAWWRDKHHRHHRHTNVPGRDADLYPVLTYDPVHALRTRGLRRAIATHQALLLPLLLCATRAFFQYLSLRFVLAHPRLVRRELPLMLVHHALFLGLPVAMLEPGLALAWIAVGYCVTGVYMGLVFLTNHTGMPLTTDIASGVPPLRQAAITRNVRAGRVGGWLWGGLNYQIEHHLVPDLPRRSMRAAAPRVRAFCARHGICYHCVDALTAWSEVARHAHAVGAPLRRIARRTDGLVRPGGPPC